MADFKSLAEALAAFQAIVPKMSKDETAKVKSEKANYTYGYAGLDQFVEIVEPVLGTCGLAVTSRTTYADGVFMLEVSLVHESGERETAYWPLPDPRRAGPQDLGSAMTYGRRYLGWGLTGTFPGGIDDDGKQAQASHRESWDDARPARQARPVSAPPAPPTPPAEPAKPPKTSWTDTEVYDIQAKMGTVTVAQALGAYDWMAGKDLHNREVSHPGKPDAPKMTATTVVAVKIAGAAQDPANSPEMIANLRAQASDRGLLKVQVSPDGVTLEQVLHEAAELAAYEATQGSPGSAGSDSE